MPIETPCWEYFNCPKKIYAKCPVYIKSKIGTVLYEGWFIFDTLKGGPAERGPCYTCEMAKRHYPDIRELHRNK